MLSMQGKNAVVFGVANKRSIAWAIAQSLSQAGARLAITYQNERMKQEAHDLITSLPGAEAFQCDVASDSEIEQFFAQLKERFGRLDALDGAQQHADDDQQIDHNVDGKDSGARHQPVLQCKEDERGPSPAFPPQRAKRRAVGDPGFAGSGSKTLKSP